MKRWIQRLVKSTLLFSILMIPPVNGVLAADMPDIPKQYAAEADLLISKGVIQGYKDGTFKPENSVSRLDAAIMIGRSLGLNGEPRETGFHDVPVDHRGSGYVAEMRDHGIINGFNETTFAPYRPLSRGDMSLFLHRAFHDLKTPYDPTAFFDLSSRMQAFQSIRYMTQSGVSIGFPDGTFRPGDHVTRMQMSLFLARALNEDFRVSPVPLPEQPRIASTKTAEDTDQILTVVHNGNGRATVTYWKKDPYVWTKVRKTTNGFVGINGVSETKREGDRNAPVGSFRMPFAFGTDNPGTKMPYKPITNRSYWISNVNDPHYNTWQERSSSHAHDEHLIRYRDQYKYAMAIDYNMDNPIPGKGSAIFLHVSNGTPTLGCVSVPESMMRYFMQELGANTGIIIVENEADIYTY
ncbi:S-layer homology domain-containing protein [Salisediminibacterium selenitireducens]|uniref:S-layer domain protein n=1 Tax=Bacillus selenitireducens (strain ATCC 700615 / DSM 15326 / MLS10) TaxID=439292 RepID=D6Y0A4_BACIE|nr:S-layer homology domain-containing protein [Salisediminibacterium selenitireducens]ADH98495.1 S-layer domain protein [[Bacillus] selenitireducens MLS10]